MMKQKDGIIILLHKQIRRDKQINKYLDCSKRYLFSTLFLF